MKGTKAVDGILEEDVEKKREAFYLKRTDPFSKVIH